MMNKHILLALLTITSSAVYAQVLRGGGRARGGAAVEKASALNVGEASGDSLQASDRRSDQAKALLQKKNRKQAVSIL